MDQRPDQQPDYSQPGDYEPTRSRGGQPQYPAQDSYAGQPYASGQQPYPQPYYAQPAPPKKRRGLQIAGFGCLGVVALVVILVVAAAVGSSKGTTVNTTAAGDGGTTAANTPAAGKSAAAAGGGSGASKKAGLGATINITDISGDKLAVTLKKVDAKPHSTNEFESPDSGNQYYAAQFEIKDVGDKAWSDDPSNCVVVKDGKGQTFQSTIVSGISSGPMIADVANLAAGDSTLGWIVFEVPKGDKVTTVQFTPLSGMDDDTAQWTIG
jgi:hypothetical protein